MRLRFAGAASAILLGSAAAVQGLSPGGTWRGTSICLVRNSPCHDETVVYHITRSSGADSVAIDALKIVNGQEEDMGVLTCGASTSAGGVSLMCAMRNGVWSFHVRGDTLIGELRLPDGSKLRDVRATRAR